jgi:hypothetical protein
LVCFSIDISSFYLAIPALVATKVAGEKTIYFRSLTLLPVNCLLTTLTHLVSPQVFKRKIDLAAADALLGGKK